MNSMEGSQTIPTYVEYENALVFGHNLVEPAGSWFRSSAAAAAATALHRRHSAADLCPPVANCKYLRFPVCDSTY